MFLQECILLVPRTFIRMIVLEDRFARFFADTIDNHYSLRFSYS